MNYIGSGYKTANYKTAKSQNSDCYKTATTKNDDCYKTAKIIQKNLPNCLIKNQRF